MKLFFRKSGEGKPLIILHGLFGMSDNWMTISRQLSESGNTVYATDARNHGRSGRSDEFNYAVMSADILELMDDENIESATVIGHSLGGKTAMWLACEHPSRVAGLVVADMATRNYPPHHQQIIAAIESMDFNEVKTRREAESKLREMLSDEGYVQFLLKNIYWDENENLNWRFYFDGIKKNISEVGIALPENYHYSGKTLFLRGAKSGYINDADIIEIRKHFPSAKVETIPGAGHWIHAENPSGFMASLKKFLEKD